MPREKSCETSVNKMQTLEEIHALLYCIRQPKGERNEQLTLFL